MVAQIIPSIVCPDPVLGVGKQGIARIAVDDASAELRVTFLRPLVLPDDDFLLDPRSYTLTGGQSLFPRVTQAALLGPGSPPYSDTPVVLLTLTGIGDFSVYTLTVSGSSIDPFFAGRKLRFRIGCDERFDCRPPALPPTIEPEIDVAIDYLAKDYASFRQALLDFVPTRRPEWVERSEADLGMVLLELFTATADTLSYMQDRVFNEAFLGTATQRRSVANHLALIGYQMDQGASAYTWLHFAVNEVRAILADTALKVSNRPESTREPVLVFETLGDAVLRPKHNRMEFYTWGNKDCCLPITATSAALTGTYADLAAGDYLLVEDEDGNRDIVRLTDKPDLVSANVGALSSPPADGADLITIVRWSDATPLSRDYCLCESTASPPDPCAWVRGNIVPATHGETVTQDLRRLTDAQKQALQIEIAARPSGAKPLRQRLPLASSPLAHLDPSTLELIAPPGSPAAQGIDDPVAAIIARTPRGISTLSLDVVDGAASGQSWQELGTLLSSGPNDAVFRVEIDDDGEATVVFGDGVFGLRPDEAATVTATYRVGGGSVGNIAADTLTRAIPDQPWLDAVTNPLSATGGRDFETAQHARQMGPASSHAPLMLVTNSDYQQAAQDFTDAANSHPIQRAKATFSWTGSWLSATLAVDPAGGAPLDADLAGTLGVYIDERRLAGYDAAIVPAIYVPLDLIVSFCAARGFRPADVEAGLLRALSNQVLPGGKQGFFHPDRFSFGDDLYVSQLFAAVMAAPGVDSATISRLARLHAAQPDAETASNLARGSLQLAPDQILRLDNDRNFPQNGTLTILVKGAER